MGERPGSEQATEDEPDAYRGAGYIFRGVRYGETVPELQSRPAEEPDDDDPADSPVVAVMSENPPAAPPAEGGEAGGHVAEPAWWEGGPRPEEAAGDQPGEEEAASDTPSPFGASAYGESVSEPRPQPAEEPVGDEDPVDAPAWWQGLSGTARPGRAQPDPEEPVDDTEPVDTPVPAVVSEDRPAAAPAEAAEAREPVVESPWWERTSKPEEAPEEHPEDERGDADLAAPYLYSGMDYGDVGSESRSRPPEGPNDDDEPADMSVPAGLSADRPDVPGAGGGEAHAGEDPLGERGEADQEPPGSSPDFPAAADALPEGPPGELIRSMVADICPGELLLVGTVQAPLPEWAGAAVTALRDDLDRRLAGRNPGDADDFLRLAIVENAMGLHEAAEAHLKEALPRSDRFGPVLNALAVTSLARGRVAPAIVYCKEALRETGGDDYVRAAASSNLGDLYDLQGDAAQAAEAYQTAIDCLQSPGDSAWLSRLHLRVGQLYRRAGQADKARLHFSDAVRLFEDSGDEAGRVQALAALGSSLTESGLHDLALRSFEEAVRICLRTADKPGAALVQDELGIAYMAQDQLTRALAYFESALSLHRELDNPREEAATLNNMGKIHDSRGDVDEARRFYEAATKIDRALGRDVDEAGEAPRIDGGDHEAARAKLLKAEEIFSRVGSAERQEDAWRVTERSGPQGRR